MHIFEQGSGDPLLLIPGLQGRWEYLRPAIDALSVSFRVITFHLCGERASGETIDRACGMDNYTRQAIGALDRCGIDRAVVCGISFGGLVALRVAAYCPDRTSALILASTPGPGWHLRRHHELYARFPYLFAPVFLAGAPRRLRAELAAAFPSRTARRRFARSQLRLLLRAPLSVGRMAERARMIATGDVAADCGRVTAPTLVITGDPRLDHVVSARGSVGYVTLIRGARGATLERTGHLGSITRPDAFAAIVREFYARAAEPKERVVIDGADHLFDGKVSEVAGAIEDLLGDWSA